MLMLKNKFDESDYLISCGILLLILSNNMY